ncbi:MAG: helix-turn-helix transcriptional regulator [Candidatus Gastranaerophilales bacterium]
MHINDFKKRIGLNIKSLRIKKDLKQIELADFAQISHTTLSKIECGEQNFTIETLYSIAEILKMTPEELLKID